MDRVSARSPPELDADRAPEHLTTAYHNGDLKYHLIARHPVFDELRDRPAYRGVVGAIQDEVARQGRCIV